MPANLLPHRLNPRGFTLLEITIVLSIVGIIIAGVWFYGAQTLYNAKVEKLQSQIVHIITRSHEVFGNNSVPNNTDLTQGAITANIFPTDALGVPTSGSTTSGYIAIEPFAMPNGTVAQYSFRTLGPLNGAPTFLLSIPSVPTDACVKIISYMGAKATVTQLGLLLYGPANLSFSQGFGINGTPVYWAAQQCAAISPLNGTNNGLAIMFQL